MPEVGPIVFYIKRKKMIKIWNSLEKKAPIQNNELGIQPGWHKMHKYSHLGAIYYSSCPWQEHDCT